jgi:5-dehydro-2-deoxygluconokinase
LIDWTKRELLILAFDHRGSFTEKLFEIKNRQPTAAERVQIEDAKKIIFEGFIAALGKNVPKDIAGMLVDEEFGKSVLVEAKARGFTFAMPVEKSGQDEFDFEYGEDFGKHIQEFDPTLVKVLVRYNTAGDDAMNKRQLERLKKLNDYLQQIQKPFLFELLVPATSEQLAQVGGAKDRFDREMRPNLMIQSIAAIQDAGINPAIWKLEGVDKAEDAKAIVSQVQKDGRQAGVITLGRGESKENVQKWLAVGAKVTGIIGFAVGRTIFWQPLVEYRAGKSDREPAVEKISQHYAELAELWVKERGGK